MGCTMTKPAYFSMTALDTIHNHVEHSTVLLTGPRGSSSQVPLLMA